MLSQELNLSLCSLSYYYTQRNFLWLDWNLRFHEACISSKNMLHTDKRSKNIYIYACNLFLAALKTLENLEESTSEEVILVWSSWYEQSAFNFTKRRTLHRIFYLELLENFRATFLQISALWLLLNSLGWLLLRWSSFSYRKRFG